MFKEFRCPENTDKVLIVLLVPGSSKDYESVDGRFVMTKQQMEFQSFKIIQDFKKEYIHAAFFFFFFFFFLHSL